MKPSGIQDIIRQLDDIVQNKSDKPLDQLGSYIVGATLVRDDIEEYYSDYPLLGDIAELGAELETLAGTDYAPQVFAQIEQKLNELKSQQKFADLDK